MFENALRPSIRNEQVREDSVRTFAAARAHKHASHNVHDVNTTHLSSVVSAPTQFLKNQFETRLDKVHATVTSLVEGPNAINMVSLRQNIRALVVVRRKTPRAHRIDKKSRKNKSTRATHPSTCAYEHCMHPATHKTEGCLFTKLTAKIEADS